MSKAFSPRLSNTIRPGHSKYVTFTSSSLNTCYNTPRSSYTIASRRKLEEPLLDPACTFFLCPTCQRPPKRRKKKKKIDKQQVSIRNQIPDAGERRTFMGYVQVTAHSEPMGDTRKHLEEVTRLVADQDIFRTTSCLERERKVDLCRTNKGGKVQSCPCGKQSLGRRSPEQDRRRGPVVGL